MARFVGNSALLNRQQLIRKKPLKKKIEWKFPDRIEKTYIVNLTQMVDNWKKALIDLVLPNIDQFVQESSFERPPESNNQKIDSIRNDDWVQKLENLVSVYNIRITPNENALTQGINFTAHEVSNFNTRQWFTVTNTVLGVPLLQNEPWLNSTINGFTKENTALIKSLKDTTIQQIDTTINRGIKQGLRIETIKKQLLEGTNLQKGVFNKLEKRAALIARDQVSKLNGQLTQLRQTGVGISQYTWWTSHDERVRQSHKALDGMLCKWSDSSVFSMDDGETWLSRGSIGGIDLHPGQDYQCRCWPESDFSTLDLGGGF